MRTFPLIGLFFFVSFHVFVGSAMTESLSLPSVEVTQPLHFLTPGGEDVVVQQGRYEVGQASEWLHLSPVGGEKTDAILVEAQPINHTETLEVPTAFSSSEQEDAYTIILLLPDGTGLEALGSSSGVQSKGVRRPNVRRAKAAQVPSQGLGQMGTSHAVKPAPPKVGVASDQSLRKLPSLNSPDIQNKLKIGPRTQPDGRVGNTPNQGAGSKPNLPEVGPMPGPLRIGGASLEPDKKIGSVDMKLAPAGTIHIFGDNFGTQQGTVSLRVDPSHFPEYPSGVPLQITKWSDKWVSAKVPSPMTGPIFSVNVAIRLTRENPVKTVEFIKEFQVPVDKRILKRTDDEVRLILCDGILDYDNKCNYSSTMSAYHWAPWDAAVHNKGIDQYAIHLTNGWVFSRLIKKVFKVTGDDGDYLKLSPAFPVGKTKWNPSLTFWVSSDDEVSYQINVEVMRAKGAY